MFFSHTSGSSFEYRSDVTADESVGANQRSTSLRPQCSIALLATEDLWEIADSPLLLSNCFIYIPNTTRNDMFQCPIS